METSRRRPRARWALFALVSATTVGASAVFGHFLWSHGSRPLYLPLLLVFSSLFVWTASMFWATTLGFLRLLLHPEERPKLPPFLAFTPNGYASLPRTAILMPIHNEDPWQVTASLRTMHDAIRAAGHGDRFDFFILSDTTDPDTWLEEELAWAALRQSLGGAGGLYYRRRRDNAGHKSGNIADFCKRWGGAYKYMVVLDADSIMAGSTLLEMVRRMEEDPQVGILQVPSHLVNRGTLFARAQQFASSVYGDMFVTGYALWSQTESNYWGHNAILRVEPFVRHCGLPVLPGRPPLGGEILSHDFVEAALMRRAGWKTVIASDLGGSYEECPTTLLAFAKRDQRWCQGNLQHLRLVLKQGFHVVTRAQLGLGAMSYLSSPLWLTFMILATFGAAFFATHEPGSPEAASASFFGHYEGVLLFAFSMALLLLPKVWGYLLLLHDRQRLEAHGGPLQAAAGVGLETLIWMLLAPVTMLFHTSFVIAALRGRRVAWEGQPRDEADTPLGQAVHAHAAHTIGGLAATLAVQWIAPGGFWWVSPVLFGLVFSIPLSMLLSSTRAGLWLESRGLLLAEEETAAPPILRAQRQWRAQVAESRRAAGNTPPFAQVVLDPAFNALHAAILKATGADDDANPRVDALRNIALYGGPKHLTPADKLLLLSSRSALAWLHRMAWQSWPLATLNAMAAATRVSPFGSQGDQGRQVPAEAGG